jgi:hypothetical protein
MTAEREPQRAPDVAYRDVEAEASAELSVGIDDGWKVGFEGLGEVVETELQRCFINRRVVLPKPPPHIGDEPAGVVD